MMKLLCAAAIVALAGPAVAGGSHYVQGHVTQNGTYVAPHYQTNPNSNPYDNWSTRPNVNPYTGQQGTRDPNAIQQGYRSAPGYGYGTTGNNGQ